MKRILLFLACLLVVGTGALWAQSGQQVSGVVTENGAPLAGVSVSVKGTATAVLTDGEGRYTITVPENATLVFSFIGMQTQEIEVGGRTVINAELVIETTRLEDVIVVAYGTAKKESFVGSAGVISSRQLAKRTVSNVTKALEGSVAGVQTTSGSGQPGSGSTIRVRGFGSIYSSNDPLYVVDGAPYDGSYAAISPDDIESITILKDASAGALYGARGANGVVLITTKSGANTDGRTKVSAKASWGISSRAIPRYDLLDEKGFLEASFTIYRNKAMFTDGIAPNLAGAAAINDMLASNIFGVNEQYNSYNMPVAQLIDPATGKINPDAQLRYHHDWLDEVTAVNPLRQEYTINISGGDKKTKYYASFNYLDEQGLLKTTSFERLQGRVNVNSQIKPWIKIGGDANIAFNKTNNQGATGSATSNVWYSAQSMAPIYPVYELEADGLIKYDDTGKPIYDYGLSRPAGAQPEFNSVALMFEDKYYSNSDNISVHGFAEVGLNEDKYGWAKGFSLKIDVSATNQNSRSTTYYNPLHGNASPPMSGRLGKSTPRVLSVTFNQILGYNHSFGEHNIDVIVGHESYALKGNTLSASKTGFPFPGIYELDPGSTLASISSVEDNYRIESYLSRLKYSYADKYNFEASFRTDGSSRFHTDSRWGNFWSVGANWRISEEDFLSSVDWIDNLSVRVSYGEQGNDALGTYYAWQSFYDLGLPNAGFNGSAVTSLESRDLKWEKNANFNVGVETRLFDRVNLTAEFFNRTTSDMLLDVPMATSLGFPGYSDNIGSMYNQGVEFALNVEVVKSDNFDWTLNLLGTSIKNEITALATEKPIIDGSFIFKVGEPIYSYYLPRSAGVDPATGQQLYYVWDDRDPITDEQASEAYISSDGSKAAVSREAVGNKMPKFYGSIGSEFTILKGIDFSFLTTYSIGGKALDAMYLNFMSPSYPGNNMHSHVLRAWQNPGDITDIPRLELNSTNRTTQSHLLDASYFAIRNITLGYTLPREWTYKIGLESIRIYASADNLVLFSKLDGFDPQSSFTSTATYSYTPVRIFALGVNINL
jgi:TonB-linked SusC/RagA family outer membrane protein